VSTPGEAKPSRGPKGAAASEPEESDAPVARLAYWCMEADQ